MILYNWRAGTGKATAKFTAVAHNNNSNNKIWICKISLVIGSKWERDKGIGLDPVKKKLGQLSPRDQTTCKMLKINKQRETKEDSKS